jgi:hypothetical protein
VIIRQNAAIAALSVVQSELGMLSLIVCPRDMTDQSIFLAGGLDIFMAG